MTRSDDDGFLSRWSRRKSQARSGAPEPAAPADAPADLPAVRAVPAASPVVSPAATAVNSEATPAPSGAPTARQAPPAPTMDDVAGLTPKSDYSRFVARNVDPSVRNAAMKKLFTDPHFNVMDGLDVYIDDYGKPDPLPLSMLRQMAQADFLNLFPEDRARRLAERAAAAGEPAADPATPKDDTLLADASPASAPHEHTPHEDPDLRLQPDDAAGRPVPGEGPGA